MEHNGQRWFCYIISVHPNKILKEPDRYGNYLETNHYHKHILKVINYPDHIIEKRHWFIDYLVAKYKVRFPRHKIGLTLCPYFPEDSNPLLLKKRQISAAKAQISKVLNIMEERRQELSKQLFQDYDNDPILSHCESKLEEKKFKLQQLLLS